MLTDKLRTAGPEHAPAHPRETFDRCAAAAERATRAQGRNTVRKLMAAGLAEFSERGFAAVTVDDVVRRAATSHGTFYLYFANKDDFFAALSQDAMRAMEDVANDFPVVTPNDAGRAALGRWVRSFCETYAAHATVFRIMTQADEGCEDAWQNGLTLLTRLAEVVSLGMTAGMVGSGAEDVPVPGRKAELDALACLLMLERVNYLCSAGVQFMSDELADRLTAIMFAAFHTTSGGQGDAETHVKAATAHTPGQSRVPPPR